MNPVQLAYPASSTISNAAPLHNSRFSLAIPAKFGAGHADQSNGAPIIRLWNGSARVEIVRWGVIDPATREIELVRPAQRNFAYRCLVPLTELTIDQGDGMLLTIRSERDDWFMAAGVWKPVETLGVAGFSLLTCEAGPDLAPMISVAPLVIDEDHWADWIDHRVDVPALIRPAPAGTFVAEFRSKRPAAA